MFIHIGMVGLRQFNYNHVFNLHKFCFKPNFFQLRQLFKVIVLDQVVMAYDHDHDVIII